MLQVILNWLESAPTGWMVNKIKNNPAVHFGLLGASSFTAARSAPQIVLSLWQVQVSTMLGENASTRPPCEFSYSLSPSRSFSYHECEALLSRAFVLRRRTQRCLAYTPPFRRFGVANNGTTFVIQNARSAPNTKKASAPSNGNDDRTFAKSVNYMLKMKSKRERGNERLLLIDCNFYGLSAWLSQFAWFEGRKAKKRSQFIGRFVWRRDSTRSERIMRRSSASAIRGLPLRTN